MDKTVFVMLLSKLRNILFGMACLLGAANLALADYDPDEIRDDLRISLSSATANSIYYDAAKSICRFVNRDSEKNLLKCRPESSPGSIFNLQLLRQAEADFAIVQSDWQKHSYNGTGPFEAQGSYNGLRYVMALHDEAFTILARRDSNVDSFANLTKGRVNLGEPGSGARATMDLVMQVKGWDTKSFLNTFEISTDRVIDALCSGEIDALATVIGHPHTIVEEAIARCDAKIISVDDDDIRAFVKAQPEYLMVEIPAKTYKGHYKPITSFGVKALLLTAAEVNEETVYNVTKSVVDNLADFQSLHQAYENITMSSAAHAGRIAPMHKGARRCFEDAGVKVD
jgi:TRAP transporter TAXI family solute receptor